jgi:hypothetical protein
MINLIRKMTKIFFIIVYFAFMSDAMAQGGLTGAAPTYYPNSTPTDAVTTLTRYCAAALTPPSPSVLACGVPYIGQTWVNNFGGETFYYCVDQTYLDGSFHSCSEAAEVVQICPKGFEMKSQMPTPGGGSCVLKIKKTVAPIKVN